MNPQIGVNMNNIQTHRLGTYLLEVVTKAVASYSAFSHVLWLFWVQYCLFQKKPKVWNTETISNWSCKRNGTSQLKLCTVLLMVAELFVICQKTAEVKVGQQKNQRSKDSWQNLKRRTHDMFFVARNPGPTFVCRITRISGINKKRHPSFEAAQTHKSNMIKGIPRVLLTYIYT